MAIDTRERRQNIAGLNLPNVGVIPNLSQDQEWRQESGWGYGGILVTDEAAIPIAVALQPAMEPYPLAPIIDKNGFISMEWHRWFQAVIDSEFSMLSEQEGPPGTAPSRTGLTNIDTLNKNVYISAGTNSSADWILVN